MGITSEYTDELLRPRKKLQLIKFILDLQQQSNESGN